MAEIRVKSNFGEAGAGIYCPGEVGLKEILQAIVENQQKIYQAVNELNTKAKLEITLPELDKIIFEK
ncbi:MAG: hypothetical protein AB1349_01560 [Elusimicrobiota bacterium]